MATKILDKAQRKRNGYKPCEQCNLEVMDSLFPLIGPWKADDSVYSKICQWCINPGLKQTYTEKQQAKTTVAHEDRKKAIQNWNKRRNRRCLPIWADINEIKRIYARCRRISRETGVPHHVDHIIPIKHLDVCGLHTPLNLQIIPAVMNSKKSNHYIVI